MTAKIWYYPDTDGGTLETIDLTEHFSDIRPQPFTIATDTYNGSGRRFRSVLRSGFRIFFENNNFDDSTGKLERDLLSLEAHLKKGKTVSFANDASKSWCGFATDDTLSRGDTFINVTQNVFFGYESVSVLSLDDEFVITSVLPENNREWLKVLSHTTSPLRITMPRGLRYSYRNAPIFIRHRDFHPVLRLPEDGLDQSILSHDRHRNTNTLRLVLEEDISGIAALADSVGNIELNVDTAFGGGTLDELINDGEFGSSVPEGFYDVGTEGGLELIDPVGI